jgi:outer membrane protein assembly factor BamB
VPSPLLHDGVLYILKHNTGVLSALDAATGKVHYGPARLEGIEGVYASPVSAAGRVYVAGRNGATAVLAAGPVLKVLALNRLDDGFETSPAVVGREIYLRGSATCTPSPRRHPPPSGKAPGPRAFECGLTRRRQARRVFGY